VSASHFVLLIEDAPSASDSLAATLVRLGVEPIRVGGLREAISVIKSRQYQLSGLLIPSDIPGKEVRKAMKAIRKKEPELGTMCFGKEPNSTQRNLLRQAGILLALWNGYDEAILRFQINRLVARDGHAADRSSQRAPTHIPVRMIVGGRRKEGILYSLSEGGCFVHTSRASMDGARLRLGFRLEDEEIELEGVVAFANVPGNLQRPNLPLGMGIRFEDDREEVRGPISRFIRSRLESLEV